MCRFQYTLTQQPLDEVDQFTYLGSIVTEDSSSDQDVVSGLGKAMTVMQWLRPIWRSNAIALGTEIWLLNSIDIPIPIYACETWKLSASISKHHFTTTMSSANTLCLIPRLCQQQGNILNNCYPPLGWCRHRAPFSLCGPYSSPVPRTYIKDAHVWTPSHGKRKQRSLRQTWRCTFIEVLHAVDLP